MTRCSPPDTETASYDFGTFKRDDCEPNLSAMSGVHAIWRSVRTAARSCPVHLTAPYECGRSTTVAATESSTDALSQGLPMPIADSACRPMVDDWRSAM